MYRISWNYNTVCNDRKNSSGPCAGQSYLFSSANYIPELETRSVNLLNLLRDKKNVLPFRKYLADKNINSYVEFNNVLDSLPDYISVHKISKGSGFSQRVYFTDLHTYFNIDKFVYTTGKKELERLSFLFGLEDANKREKSKTGQPIRKYRYTGSNEILRELSGTRGQTQTFWTKMLELDGYRFYIGEEDLDKRILSFKSNQGEIYRRFNTLNNSINQYATQYREEFTSKPAEEQKQIVINGILESVFKQIKFSDVHSGTNYIRYSIPFGDDRYNEQYADIVINGRRADQHGLTMQEWADVLNVSKSDIRSAFIRFNAEGKSPEEKDKVFSNILYVDYLAPDYKYTGNNPKVLEFISKAQTQLNNLLSSDSSDIEINNLLPGYKFLNDFGKQKRVKDFLSGGFVQSELATIFNKSQSNVRQICKRRSHTQAKQDYLKVIEDTKSDVESMKFLEQNKQEITNEVFEVLAGIKHSYNMEKLLNDQFWNYNKDGVTFKRQQLIRYQLPGDGNLSWALLDGVFLKDGKIILVVECQGQQHYQFVRFNKTTKQSDWLRSIKRDRVKLSFCHDLNIPLIYVSRYLSNDLIKKLFINLRSNLNYYSNEVPEQPDVENFIFVPNQDPDDIEQEVQIYSDRLVSDHLKYIKDELYKNISDQIKFKFLKDKLIALSKLVILFEKSFSNDEADFAKSFTYETDLSRGYEFVRRSFEKISDNPIDFSGGINFGMIESSQVSSLQKEHEKVDEFIEEQKQRKLQNRSDRKPVDSVSSENFIPIPQELSKASNYQFHDAPFYRKLITQGKSIDEALRISLERINGRNLRSRYENELLRKGFNRDEINKFYAIIKSGKNPQEAMDEISSRMKRKRDYSYREELIELGFKTVNVLEYEARVKAGEDPEFVKSDILQKINKKKKEIAEYAFGRNKKKRYRINIINKKRSGVAMKKTLGNIVKIANLLDSKGLHNEADKLTRVAVKLAQNFDDELGKYESRTQRENERYMDDGFEGDDDYSGLAALENDPLMKRYKMEYQKDPMGEGDEELEDLVHQKLLGVLSGTYLEDSLNNGDDFYIMEEWLDDKKSLVESAYDYEMSLRDRFDDYPSDDYDPLDD